MTEVRRSQASQPSTSQSPEQSAGLERKRQHRLRGLLARFVGSGSPDVLNPALPTFARAGAPQALVPLRLPSPPRRRTLPIPQSPLPPETREKLVSRVTRELDAAQRQGLEGRALEAQLRKTVWGQAIGASFPSGTRAERKLSNKLKALNTEIEQQMAVFMAQARAAVPGTCDRDIKRACTNIWPMLCLQALDGRPLTVTGAMLGFSMLYPLTDDIIDEPSLSRAAKKDFLQRFARLISHGDVEPAADAPREQDVWRMFRLIEQDWPRDRFPLAYRTMGELLKAQVDSQLQLAGPRHENRPVPPFDAVWEVTVRKGALSILCDAFLVKGDLSPAEASFASHFGLMTQFLNDIRTIDEDLAEGQYTPFNHKSSQGKKLDKVFDEVFHHFLTAFEHPDHAAVYGNSRTKRAFMRVMLSFLSFKLIEGVAINQSKFSPAYLAHLEAEASPMPLDLIKRLYDAQFRGENAAAAIIPNQEDLPPAEHAQRAL